MTDKSKEIQEIIQTEIAPIKEQLQNMQVEKENLLKETALLKATIEDKESEKSALRTEVLDALAKVKILMIERNDLIKRNKSLLRETSAISAKSRLSILSERKKYQEEKENYVSSVSSKIEKHINEVSRSAYRVAKQKFESDFSSIEENLLKDLGKMLSPYITDAELPVKMDELKESLDIIKSEMNKQRKIFEHNQEIMKDKLSNALLEAKKAKLDLYKQNLCKSLPSTLYEKAMLKMSKTNDLSELKRIYTLVMRESALSESSETPVTPVADNKTIMKTSEGKRTLNETKKVIPNKPDEDNINDPEMLKLAGIE